jgi:hypothetical protein
MRNAGFPANPKKFWYLSASGFLNSLSLWYSTQHALWTSRLHGSAPAAREWNGVERAAVHVV